MKLPRVVRKFRKFSIYVSVYIMLTIFMFTPVAQVYSSYILPRDNYNTFRIGDGNSQITDMEIIFNDPNIKKEVRPSEVGSPYTAITASSGSGNNFPVTDHLLYSKDYTKDLKFNMTSFETTDFIGNYYSAFDLGYTEDNASISISSMTAVQDFYSVEVHTDLSLYVSLDNLTARLYAQGFNVPWDYANFTRAKIYLMKNGLPLSNDEVHLTLVPEGSDGKPNVTTTLSESGPYTPQTLPSSVWPDAPIYDFDDVTLTQGNYYILLNLTTSTSNTEPHVVWFANDTAPYTDKAYKSSSNLEGAISWDTLSSVDLVLAPELYPVDVSLNPLQFSNPVDIGLKDNGATVDSSTFYLPLSYVGQHKLTSTTSVTISFTNEYKYTNSYIASSAYSVSNSTFDQMSVNWDLTWTSPEISLYYTLVSRNQTVDVGADWTDAFNWLYNSTAPFPYDKIRHHYKIYLASNESAGNWLIETTSPNHLYSAIFSDETAEADRYFLGYWTTDEVDATGIAGSQINLAAVVQSNVSALVSDDTGTVTYTVYNSTGQIIPLKAGLPANILYTDITEYSIPAIAYTTPGNWDSQIIFDPSVYETDQPGFWTAEVLWQNGTQIGFYTQRIIVQSQTYVDYDWELTPGGIYGTADVTRQQNDNVDVRVWYYNISEPFLTGNGTLIPNVDITYSTTWLTGGSFVGAVSPYTSSVLIDTGVGTNTVTIVATGAFLENHTTSFDVTVFYQLKINPVSQYYATNYTNNGIFFMYLYDESATSNLGTLPDDLIVTISNGSVAYNLSTGIDYTYTYQGAVEETWKLDLSTSTNNLAVGSYDVFVAAQYTDYRANYTKEYASDSFVLDISAPKTEIQNIGGDLSIYSYHNATISFQFVDTNHSTDILGAAISVAFSAENIIYYSYAIGNIYYINIQNNNASLSSFTVFLDISKDNYESIVSLNLRVMTVDPINTDLQIVGAPGSVSIGYPFVITVHFTDTDNNENITIAGDEIYTILTNSTDYIVISVIHWKDGLYNITIENNDYIMDWLEITIEFGETGYLNSTDIILIELVFVDTDVDLLTSPNNTIYYDQNVTVSIRYWDINSQFNISSPDIIIYEGNFTSIFNVTNIILTPTGDVMFIYINYVDNLGTYQLNITLIEFGYLPQLITIYITIEERLTVGETDDGETEVTRRNDADTTEIEVYISYTDDLNDTTINSADIQFSFVNGTLSLDTYFDDYGFTTLGLYYVIYFDPNDAAVVGQTLVIVISLSKYGYVSQIITITLVFNPASDFDMDVEIVGEVRQLETIQFRITVDNATYADVSALSGMSIRYLPDLALGSVNITYTFIFANGTEMTYWVLVNLELVGDDIVAFTDDIFIPWRVVSIKYSAEYIALNDAVVLSKTSTEEEVVTTSAGFMAILMFLLQAYTPYMAAGLAALAVVLLYLTIHFAVIRPRKQRKKAKKRRYLDKISKILTSVISMRKVIVVHNETGLPIYEWDLGGEISVDSSLVSGFLQAVSGMGGEISGGEAGAVRKIDYGQFCVSSAGTDCITTYLFTTGDISVDVETGIASFVDWFEKKFHELVSTTWDGKTDEFLANERSIIDTLSENLFVWTLHPLSVNAVKEKDVLKLDAFSQRLYKFIKDYNEVSISVALEFFSKHSMEEVLSKIFEMVDANILLRKRLR